MKYLQDVIDNLVPLSEMVKQVNESPAAENKMNSAMNDFEELYGRIRKTLSKEELLGSVGDPLNNAYDKIDKLNEIGYWFLEGDEEEDDAPKGASKWEHFGGVTETLEGITAEVFKIIKKLQTKYGVK